jgi:hypothetical protein
VIEEILQLRLVLFSQVPGLFCFCKENVMYMRNWTLKLETKTSHTKKSTTNSTFEKSCRWRRNSFATLQNEWTMIDMIQWEIFNRCPLITSS